MTEFQLDTSGYVRRIGAPENWQSPMISWPDLSPFVQGYVEALAASTSVVKERGWFTHQWVLPHGDKFKVCAFSDLAPETLARIIEDCAKRVQEMVDAYGPFDAEILADDVCGRQFWEWRQHAERFERDLDRFPSLTLSLNDDGKVVFG